MTIFRFSFGKAALGMLLLCGCEAENRPVREIIASNLSDEELLKRFADRLQSLEGDKDVFDAEMRAAGFVPKALLPNCTSWEYPVQKPEPGKPDNALRAFVIACGSQGNALKVQRAGIAHQPMSYD